MTIPAAGDPLGALLDAIAAAAALPMEHAVSLPPAAYRDPALYAREVRQIFRRDWLCVARTDWLAEPGAYVAVDVAGEPLLVTRDEQGTLRALSRVCRHRGMDLVPEAPCRGVRRRLVCPYHLWSYRLDGGLAGAPEMQRAVGFDRGACRLPRFALEVWQGFVFVNLDPDAAPLAPRLVGLEAALGGVDMSGWATAATLDWGAVDVNWKVAVENGSEAYHHLGTHRESLQPLWPASDATVDHVRDRDWFYGCLNVSAAFATGRAGDWPIHPTFFPPVDGLSDEQRSRTLIAGVFPMFFFALAPDFCTWFRWFPTGPTSHWVDLHVLVPPATPALHDFGERLAQVMQALRNVQSEDVATNAAVQRGLAAAAAAPGRLSHLEQPIWQLQRYLAARLA